MTRLSTSGERHCQYESGSTKCAWLLIIAAGAILAACGQDEFSSTAVSRPILQAPQWIDDPAAGPILPITAEVDTTSHLVQLGKTLFHDTRLSADNTVSCSSCHDIEAGGDDGRRVSIGINGAEGELNAPTVLNSALNFAQFWDGRAATLAEQAIGPIHDRNEMGTNFPAVLKKLAADNQMVSAFDEAFDDGMTSANLLTAIAGYESALITASAFDRYLLGDKNAISETAKLGFNEFQKLGCISCHQGRNIGGNMYQYFGIMGDYFTDRGNIRTSDFGRYNVTKNPVDKFKFKVPSLRNVAVTAPYFHDGSAATLDDAIAVMAQYQLGRPINRTQIDLIVAFLETLTGEIEDDLL